MLLSTRSHCSDCRLPLYARDNISARNTYIDICMHEQETSARPRRLARRVLRCAAPAGSLATRKSLCVTCTLLFSLKIFLVYYSFYCDALCDLREVLVTGSMPQQRRLYKTVGYRQVLPRCRFVCDTEFHSGLR